MKRTLNTAAAALLAAFIMPLTAGGNATAAAQTLDRQTLIERATVTYEAVRKQMATSDSTLLQEKTPRAEDQNEYSYLWGYSALVSAVSALYETTGTQRWSGEMEKRMLRGLDRYRDTSRQPPCYASYVNDAPPSDRFYDDNIWLGIDMADLYSITRQKQYLERAEEIWAFVMSGCDEKLGGGIYWCEQKKESKNTCSNAPAAVFALKMHTATGEQRYLDTGRQLYEWTKETLRDSTDNLYFDHITLKGRIGRAKYSYNTGQMMQAAALLYKITGKPSYLDDAKAMAQSAYMRFFENRGDTGGLRLPKGGEMWFDAVMLRGYIELYTADRDKKYINALLKTMDEAWQEGNSRDADGLFGARYDSRGQTGARTLLNQAAMIEMMARLAAVAE